ncbi:unnamed protein product [Paramecium sonneborni]|uniref:JmjC domain-containing protein n=1 Tax=Paramecium sonneborni TaxID=65129 RepID=A0A8S1K7B1_9CILI|nr:unnamed protein product [Paramecium sonneborni]
MNQSQKQYEFKNVNELKTFLKYNQRESNQYEQIFNDLLHEKLQEFPNKFDNSLSLQEFQIKYDSKIPIVIKGLDIDWDNWNWNYLIQNYSEYYFRCAIDDDGNYLKLKFDQYIQYLRDNDDYNPFYIFDGDIPENMLNQYKIPYLFPQDYLSYLKQKRPQYRWILCGPKKSGSMIHVDPYETSAWNCVVLGKKRWIMFPPTIDKNIVKGKTLINKEALLNINNPIDYFSIIVPLVKKYCDQQNILYYDFIQDKHDTVYVPNGWWHAVLNIEDCVAVTQNYVNDQNFDQFWMAFNKENPTLSQQFQTNVQQDNLELYQKILILNSKYNIQIKSLQQDDNISEQDSLDEFQNQFD